RFASRLARRAAVRSTTFEPQSVPENAPRSASAWEKEPAVPPRKDYWKTAVIFLYIGGPAYAFYTWLTWTPT
ncbi:hypothetical protein CPB86DRAFT_660306, partial [Serendipita vermifera]